MHELELNNNEDQELDLTNATICDLTGSATNGSLTASLSDCRRASSFSSANDLSSDEPPIVKDLRTSKGFVPTPEKNEPTKPRSSVPMSNITLSEQEIEDALDRCDVQQQVRASIVSLPGEMQFRSSLQLQRKRSWFLSKLSALRKNMKKSEKPKKRSLKFFDIYKYADKYDIILMIIGAIAALSVGGSYTVIFYIYQQVLNIFADGHTAQTNITVNITNPCYELSHQQNTSTRSLELKDVINYYIIVAFVNILLSWIAWSCWIISAERQVRRIRYLLFRNILRQEMGWFDLQKTGALSNRLTIDLNKMKDGMSEKVPDFLALFGRMIGSLLYSFIVGWKLTLVYLSMSPLVILTFNLTLKVIVRCTLKEVETFSSASSIAQEVLQNIRTVTAFHGQEKEEERFANNLLETKKAGIQKGIYVGLCQSLSTLISYVIYAVIIWYGPYLSRTDCSNYSPGAVIVVFFSSMTAAGAISSFVPNVQNFAEAAGSGIHVFDIIERKSQIDTTSDQGEKPQNVTGHIEFRNVTFTYPSRLETSVLNKLSLEIPAGKTVALVGPSGCGKSTTVQLIQRFYDPDQGQILLDGKDLRTLNVQWLRSQIGIVSQEPVLFMGSIEDNIKFGKPDATDDEVIAAAKMANAHEFIMALPDNYKTTNGDKLSGGQKQRVAIARALISNPKILLLDEATSALDNTSERVVLDTLEKAKEGRTTIVIAHRLSTIRNADIIVGIEHGQIVEYGSHDELIGRKGLYYEFVMTQSQMEITKDDDSDSDSEELDESLLIRQSVSSDRRVSRMSIFSIGNMDEYGAELDETLSNISRKGKWLHTPFIYEISKYNLPEWRWILLGTIVSLLYGSISPFYGLIFANLYKSLTEPDVTEQERVTRMYAVIAFFVGVGGCIAQFLTNLSFSKSGEGLTMRMRKMAFSAMLRQEIAYFDQETNSTGALISRLSSDASALKGLTGIRIGIFLQGISAVLVGLIVGFVSSWKLTLVIMAFSPVMLLTSKIRIQKAPTTDKIKAKPSFIEQGDQCAIQTIENIRTVVALHQENLFIKRYEQAFNQEYKKQKRFAHLTAIGLGIANSSLCFFHCICFGYGGKLVENGEISLSDMYRSFAVLIMSMMTVGRCLALVPDYSKAKAAALRIIKIHQRKSLIDPTDKSGIVLDNVTGDIEFRDVDFRYPTRATARILKHFSLKCASGQTTALVGPSGGGKSTTIALLQRFYDSQNGKILLDGHDIKVLNLQWLRSLIGIVQQEPVLFDCSIRDNIAYGDNSREITQAEVEKVARMANIHDLIISLPQGYDTLCGAKGSQLSGGQKQRIAIARALVRNPKILLLDEATSALDNKSERVVQQALDEVRSGRTCLTIAHRLSTISNSEKIAVVNRGKLAEEGTHDQLLRLNGIYTKLASAQERTPSSV